MAEEGLQDLPLPELFRRGAAAAEEAESRPTGAPEGRAALQEGLVALRAATRAVEAAALFSPNEDKDDIATADLRYLLVPYYLGELLAQFTPGNPAARCGALGSAVDRFLEFLHRCRQYELLGPESAGLLGVVEEGGSGGRPDPAALRQNKILKFKREREIKARLEALQRRAAASGEEDGSGEWGAGDEDDQREAWLLQIDLAAMKAAEKVGMLRQEMELLAHAVSLPEEEREREREPPPPELRSQLLAAAGVLQGQQANQRAQLRQQVFRPSHALPTMTVEQYGELELRQAQERQRAEAAREGAEQRRREALTEEEREGEDVAKQRAWDEFTDANPRGWGNSKTRPCG